MMFTCRKLNKDGNIRKIRVKFFFVIVALFVVSVFILLKWTTSMWIQWMPVGFTKSPDEWTFLLDGQYESCPNVLDRMVLGHWSLKNYSQQELEEVETATKRMRQFYNIPDSLQRNDNRCGNVTYEGMYYFRALCNPSGSTPCCYENVCVNKPVSECKCPRCYDLRSRVHAELADWKPADPTCKMLKFQSETQVCQVVSNTTLYFIGDSFMRQMCISVLDLYSQVYRSNANAESIKRCDKYYKYISNCTFVINSDLIGCDKTTRIYCESLWRTDHIESVLKLFRDLSGINNSWFIYGIGAHEDFNFGLIQEKILNPILKEMSKSDWPKLIWFEPHLPGLLKSPHLRKQQANNVVSYNSKVKELMDKHNVPVLRFYQLTNTTVSYDGSHYGKGVNDVKVQILLNYLLEQRAIHKTVV